jgi:hypothetical protein|tara:strand:+ start:2001 stop:2117 length:117 start_codon:yes stop_codon:yes gene_type:complete
MKEIYDNWRQFTGDDRKPAEIAYEMAMEFFTAEGLAGG